MKDINIITDFRNVNENIDNEEKLLIARDTKQIGYKENGIFNLIASNSLVLSDTSTSMPKGWIDFTGNPNFSLQFGTTQITTLDGIYQFPKPFNNRCVCLVGCQNLDDNLHSLMFQPIDKNSFRVKTGGTKIGENVSWIAIGF